MRARLLTVSVGRSCLSKPFNQLDERCAGAQWVRFKERGVQYSGTGKTRQINMTKSTWI